MLIDETSSSICHSGLVSERRTKESLELYDELKEKGNGPDLLKHHVTSHCTLLNLK